MARSGTFVLIAGGNASGKSSVIKPKYIDGRIGHYLDPDRPESLIPDHLKHRRPEFFVLGEIKEILSEKSLDIFKKAILQPENDLVKGDKSHVQGRHVRICRRCRCAASSAGEGRGITVRTKK